MKRTMPCLARGDYLLARRFALRQQPGRRKIGQSARGVEQRGQGGDRARRNDREGLDGQRLDATLLDAGVRQAQSRGNMAQEFGPPASRLAQHDRLLAQAGDHEAGKAAARADIEPRPSFGADER